MKKVIYVAGRYRGKTKTERNQNIAHARAAAIRLWKQGYVVICPHMNTAKFEDAGGFDDELFIKGDLELIRRVDCLYMLTGWVESKGAKQEYYYAVSLGKEIFFESMDGG